MTLPVLAIMNQDGELDHVAGSPIGGGAFTITSTPEAKPKAKGKGVYVTPLQYTFTGGVSPAIGTPTIIDIATTAPQSINATALKCKAGAPPGGKLVMRETDSGIMNAEGTEVSSGSTVPIAGPVEVSDAGQDKVKGD